MDTNSTLQSEQSPLAWHKPEIKRLTVSLDTSYDGGSFTDFGNSGSGPGDSDRRLKVDVVKITDALQGVLSLNGVTYHYDTTNHPEMGLSEKPQIGFIAQELEEVYPQFVVTKENGYKAVNYAPMVAVLAEAIKEQQAMIEELQKQVNQLGEKA